MSLKGIASSGTPRRQTEVLGRRQRRCCKCRCGCRRVRNATRRWCGHLLCNIKPINVKVDNPYLVTFLMSTPIWVVCGLVWLQEWTPKIHVFKRDWISCSKYDNHSRLGRQHDLGGGGPLWPLNVHKNLHVVKEWANSYELWNLWGKRIQPRFGFAYHLTLITCFIFYHNWARRKLAPFKTHLLRYQT